MAEIYNDLQIIHMGGETLETVARRRNDQQPIHFAIEDFNISFDGGESDDDEWIDEEEELIEQIPDRIQFERLRQKWGASRGFQSHKQNAGESQRKEVDNWNRLIAVVTGRAALQENFYGCDCQKNEIGLLALTLMSMRQFFLTD